MKLIPEIRCTDYHTRLQVIERIKRVAESVCQVYGAEVSVNIREGYPPVINTPDAFEIASSTVVELLGPDSLLIIEQPSMGGEDFSYYLEHVHGCFVRFGARNSYQEFIPTHSSMFDFDEEVIRIGAVYFADVARRAVARLKESR